MSQTNRLKTVVFTVIEEGACPACNGSISKYDEAWECDVCGFAITEQQAEECVKHEDSFAEELTPSDTFYAWLDKWREPQDS